MSPVKMLAFATLAAMSLGVGAAMAQEGGSSPDPNYGPAQQWYSPVPQGPAALQVAVPTVNVQAGSSDVDKSGPWAGTGANTDSAYYVGGGVGG
jgi:hypothetical protein